MNGVLNKEHLLANTNKREIILEQLRKKGFRITEQRKLLIDVILEDECSSCKEIYYKAVKKDSTVGIATVYRMVKTLEDLGLINRKNLYQIDYGNLDLEEENQVLYMEESSDKVMQVKKGTWFEQLKRTLISQGFTDVDNISILIKSKNKEEDEGCDEQVYTECLCDNLGCKYHCKKRDVS
ncbi:transcriptional repressor [Anaerocolumna sp. AGMB13025]|uniref:Fur family transcriptional regulator n=1 Tax=Anaerocolumna sp. AGMB13025 TaxID=3039116 RepID=UPI00241F6D09|nr:transcriptional repressor [Anaerocolumna sp. AGMB13025]WFR55245.1 transcriptional repressor [Anaerocolumna sp. AGMB13025]